jgi:hypothetical protein
MTFFRRTIASVAAVCVLGASIPMNAQAGMVRTDEIVKPSSSARDRVMQTLARDDVRSALVAHGVDPSQVQARVNALTDDEAQQLAQRLDQLPAGGDAIGVILFIFVLLLITDILGLTKVFPFTRPVR